MKTPKQSSNLKALRDEDQRTERKDEPRDLVNPRGSQLGEIFKLKEGNENE
jgi:hypothetical protein